MSVTDDSPALDAEQTNKKVSPVYEEDRLIGLQIDDDVYLNSVGPLEHGIYLSDLDDYIEVCIKDASLVSRLLEFPPDEYDCATKIIAVDWYRWLPWKHTAEFCLRLVPRGYSGSFDPFDNIPQTHDTDDFSVLFTCILSIDYRSIIETNQALGFAYIAKIVEEEKNDGIIYINLDARNFKLQLTVLRNYSAIYSQPLRTQVDEDEVFFREIHEAVLAGIENVAEIEPKSITVGFDFPEAVRTPCEQYLLYFGQFLKDIGVQATTDLTHIAGQALFTVTPNDPNEALERIHQALALYLHLPQNPALAVPQAFDQPMEIQRISLEIQQVNMKLTLANMALHAQQSVIKAKDEMIEAKDMKIQALAGVLSQQSLVAPSSEPPTFTPEVFVESVKAIVNKGKDSEKIAGGVVEITKWEGKGFNINLAEIYRWGRRLFQKDTEQHNNS